MPGQDSALHFNRPIYVNARQFHRILKRREARTLLERQRMQRQAKKQSNRVVRKEAAEKRKRDSTGRFAKKQK